MDSDLLRDPLVKRPHGCDLSLVLPSSGLPIRHEEVAWELHKAGVRKMKIELRPHT